MQRETSDMKYNLVTHNVIVTSSNMVNILYLRGQSNLRYPPLGPALGEGWVSTHLKIIVLTDPVSYTQFEYTYLPE